jgi:hypothetical protein
MVLVQIQFLNQLLTLLWVVRSILLIIILNSSSFQAFEDTGVRLQRQATNLISTRLPLHYKSIPLKLDTHQRLRDFEA